MCDAAGIGGVTQVQLVIKGRYLFSFLGKEWIAAFFIERGFNVQVQQVSLSRGIPDSGFCFPYRKTNRHAYRNGGDLK